MSSSYNNLYDHDPTLESANMFDLPSSLPGATGSRTNVEDHLKIIEIKKERLKALTALTKSQTILAELDIAIAECELKLELNKLRKPKHRHGSRRSKNTQQLHKASKKTPASEISTGSEQVESQKNVTCHQNEGNHNLKSPNKVLKIKGVPPKPQLRSENSSDKNNTQNDPIKESIMCSIPLNKIVQLQNLSTVGKRIISTYISQQQNADTHNTENYVAGDASNIHTSTPYHISESNHTHTCRDNMSIDLPFQLDMRPLSTQPSDNFDSTFKPKNHICISMLRVTHRYNFSIIPRCVIHNQSEFSCVEGDHINARNKCQEYNQRAALNSNRLLTICSDSDHPGDDQLF